ncbi:MAG: ABC transporter permease [Oceanospirillaceae bacterium]|jgi:simple sugar transport system permease protein|nr:ABC transporter permease [Oceanospirillaceae bacterium]MBT4442304.1 ABC transporter permease [Oceanospirillaceae bacterium]MBT6076570.1 ABC transporter permease [Oceanospirillaceae bacterium]
MQIVLEKRSQASSWMNVMSPVLAVSLTVIMGGLIFAAIGKPPLTALYLYFIDPLTSWWSIEEVLVKAGPLVLIGVGLAVCFKANVWNIGAEGQLTVGALMGAMVPILFGDWQGPWALVAMLLLGAVGGAMFAFIPAWLKTRFGVNEILTSLMLVYIAQLLLDWMVRGPWKDPHGFNFPKSVAFEGWHLLPMWGDGRMHLGLVIALVIALVLYWVMRNNLKGFEIRVVGSAPRAGAFAGFSQTKMVWFCFALSGALAGLAGLIEVAGPIGQLQPHISPNYGFTAIIVAFLGRLNPLGVVFAGLLLAVSYIGGEGVQIELGISDKTTQVFQGMLLFFILMCDTLILYRIRYLSAKPVTGSGDAS